MPAPVRPGLGRMPGNRFLGVRLLSLVLLLGLAACVEGRGLSPTPTPAASTPKPTAEPTPAPSPFVLSGVGSRATERFLLVEGPTIFRSSNEDPARGSFNVRLSTARGETVDNLIASGSGAKVSTRRLLSVVRGEYRLNVTSAGTWSVKVEQPLLSAAVRFERLEGRASEIFGPYRLTSDIKLLSASQTGTGVIFRFRDEAGLAVFTGYLSPSQANASIPAGFDEGVYWIDVEADAETDWSLKVSG